MLKGETIIVKTQGIGCTIIAKTDDEQTFFTPLVKAESESGLNEFRYTAQSNIIVAVSAKVGLGDVECYYIKEKVYVSVDEFSLLESSVKDINSKVGFDLVKSAFLREESIDVVGAVVLPYLFKKQCLYRIYWHKYTESVIGVGTANDNVSNVVESSIFTINADDVVGYKDIRINVDANCLRLYHYLSDNKGIDFFISQLDSNPLEYVNLSPRFISCFNKITCIGDSLTEGVFNTSGEISPIIPAYSYPTFLHKHTGVDVKNLGIASATASKADTFSWIDKAESRNMLVSDNFGDAYIIALGTNDISSFGSFTGNVDTDINLTDRTQNALTSVGGYANIIQYINENNPKAVIFCVTISNERNDTSTRTDANNKIKAIASKFNNCFVIDLQTYAEPTNREANYFANNYKNNSHNNALGYELRSRQFISYIDWIIEHNPSLFRNIQFYGTEYEYVE